MPICYRLRFIAFCILAATCGLSPVRAAEPAATAANSDLGIAIREAELRKALAEAERAELLARVPLAVPTLAGALDTRGWGAAGLVRAFDLAQQLATEVCTALPAGRSTVLYEAGAGQGVVAARSVSDGIHHVDDELARQNAQLQALIDLHQSNATSARSPAPLLPAMIPGGSRRSPTSAHSSKATLPRPASATAKAPVHCSRRPWRRLAPTGSRDWEMAIWANSTALNTTDW